MTFEEFKKIFFERYNEFYNKEGKTPTKLFISVWLWREIMRDNDAYLWIRMPFDIKPQKSKFYNLPVYEILTDKDEVIIEVV